MLTNLGTQVILLVILILFMLFVWLPHEVRRSKQIKKQLRDLAPPKRWLGQEIESYRGLGLTWKEIDEIGTKHRRYKDPHWNKQSKQRDIENAKYFLG